MKIQTSYILLGLQVLSALLTPTIAGIVAYVAVQQWKTNQRQLRLAMFDKRMAVFDGVIKFILITLKQDAVELNHLYRLWEEVQKHSFLFGADVAAYINEVYEKGNALRATESGVSVGRDRDIDKRSELLVWFNEQRTAASEKFITYMDFRKP